MGLPEDAGKYVRGGYFREVKQPVTMAFAPLAESLASPKLTDNFVNFSRPSTLHVLLRGLWAFVDAHGRLPAPHVVAEAEEAVALAKGFLPGVCGRRRAALGVAMCRTGPLFL